MELKKLVVRVASLTGLGVILIVIGVLAMESRPSPSTNAATVLKNETKSMSEQQQSLIAKQPVPKIEYSTARDALIERTKKFADPNKIGYLYMFAGNVPIGFYVVKGPVVSLNTYLTPDQQLVRGYSGGTSGVDYVVDAPDIDGTYGSKSDSEYFFITVEGIYVQSNQKYAYFDQPMKLTVQPLLVADVKK